MTKYIPVFLFCLSFLAADAQENSPVSLVRKAESEIERGYCVRDRKPILQSRSLLERLAASAQAKTHVQYYLALADYRLSLFEKSDSKEHVAYLSQAIERLEPMIKEQPAGAEPKLLLSLLYGMKMGTSMVLAPFLGPKSSRLSEEAMQIDSTNPRAAMNLGISKYHMPGFFGGSISEATKNLEKAVALYEEAGEPVGMEPSWGRYDAYAWLGQAYAKQGRFDEARATYEKALSFEPDFAWIKFVLLPRLEKTAKQ